MSINRRRFLQAGVASTGVSLARLGEAQTTAEPASVRAAAASTEPKRVFSISIRDYLSREARSITDRALTDYRDAATWKRLVPERRRQYMEMMGLDMLAEPGKRPPLNVKITGVVDRPAYRIEKLYYESLPQLYVTANLYVPKNLAARAPGVLYVCGHSPKQKVHYQAHPRRFAELGFVCLIVETVQLGEVRGYHHGPYYEGWFHWYSRGYSPAAVELLNGIRGLDLLSERPEVNPQRLGVTGISGGGATSWWVAAGDERVKVAASVCGTSTLYSYIADLTLDGNCDCIWWNNTYRWDLADLGALIAPRPLLIASTTHDDVFAIAGAREVHEQVRRLYAKLGAAGNLRFVVTPGGHGYHERSRTGIFSWFLQHLQGKNVPAAEVGDIDESPGKQESEETLRVYVNGSPPDNRTPTIQDTFITLSQPPEIADRAALQRVRGQVIANLRQKTFGAFPSPPPPLAPQVEYEYRTGATNLWQRFSFTSEEGWRLRGTLGLDNGQSAPAPALLALRPPGERRPDGVSGASEEFLERIKVPWAKVVMEPRGTGETAWGDQLQWHVRRATAWLGTSLASLRVYDTLRALEAVRSLKLLDGKRVALVGRGEMAAVALYAALLDGRVSALILELPPATENASSERDGRGPAIEMLNCLRITDLPQVAGLLHPVELVFVGDYPASYQWAEDLYKRLGTPERFRRVSDLATWQPS
ncbi:MAG: S9 family peptidase [Acidobacteriia bacterium]|nr:S9 family peptidase [Terriglobia bacterium]